MKKTGIKDFLNLYKMKLTNDEDIKNTKIDYFINDFRDRIKFSVHVYKTCPACYTFGYTGETLFQLDAEDLEYLKNKYDKKICEEFNHNLSLLKVEYAGCSESNSNIETIRVPPVLKCSNCHKVWSECNGNCWFPTRVKNFFKGKKK